MDSESSEFNTVTDPLHILLVEDSPDDAELLMAEVRRGKLEETHERVQTAEELKTALKNDDWDIVLADYAMPGFTGIDALAIVREIRPDIPFILVSGTIGEELAVQAMKSGADDYLLKDNLTRLVPSMEQALRNAWNRRQRKQAEEKLAEERILLRTVIDNIPDAIYAKDTALRKILANKADLKNIGLAPSEVIGKTDAEVYPKHLADSLMEDDRKVVEKGKTILKQEEHLVTDTGEDFWLLTSKLPLRNQDENIVGLVGIGRDITERKRAEERLKASEERFRNIWESSPDPMLLINSEGIFVDINPAFCRLVGQPRDKLVGQPFSILVEQEYGKKLLEKYKLAFEQREFERHYEESWSLVNNKTVHLEVTTSFQEYEDKEPLLLVLVRDATERKALEHELIHAQKMEALGQIAGGIAHDFNNVLATLSGTLQLLELQSEGDHGKKYFEMGHSSIEQARAITDRLVTFTRKSTPKLETIHLTQFLEDMTDVVTHTLPKSIEIILQTYNGHSLVRADRNQLQQVVMNLCINAAQAMNEGGTITLAVRKPSAEEKSRHSIDDSPIDYLCLVISDTGCGIEHEVVERIFDPFFTTKGDEGTGLGLAVVHKIVQSHEGWIEVKSTVDIGTNFIIGLPLTDQAMPIEETEMSPDKIAGQNRHILLVEDEPHVRELLRELLIEHEYQVSIAKDGLSGLELFKEGKDSYDLIFTDIGLPGINGLELMERVRNLSDNIPVVVITGYIDNRDRERLDSLAPQAIIRKPFDFNLILKTVADIFSKQTER